MMDVIVAGHFCVDLIPQFTGAAVAGSSSFLAPGRLTEVGALLLAMGGSVSNTGLALYKLGMDVRLVARVGDDLVGNLTREILCTHDPKLTEALVVVHGEPSSYTIVINPPDMDRTFLHCPGTNDTFGPEDLSSDLLAQARHLHFGYPPLMRRMYADGGGELTTLFRRAEEAGATTSLDTAMPDPTRPSGQADWPGILRHVLPHVHVFLPSVEELLYMLRRKRYTTLQGRVGQAHMIDALSPGEVADLAEEALCLGARVLAIKLGHRGLYLRTARDLGDMGRGRPADLEAWRGRELWAPCFRVTVVGTVGAGDSAIAGFLAALQRGQSPAEASVSAVAVGACNVEAADAISGVRSWEETQARVCRGWERLDAHVEAPGWAWDAAAGLWRGPDDR